ncbi:M48 family metallopeptidase [Pelobacter propionicus]|uniref:Peptidase M48, Ste24p n=1 Tax=Pelobacter propionicus (strain DSM 2379 / NBRC 103807 / OttBd1) TaxID=338966 RepID=A1AU50_PELPD|nr:M48 family metallopeptidase [Pelobacter propionicus]ABL00871.1 peptidase M48, Ste24p [Pelobacter propionicus DSM 2379]
MSRRIFAIIACLLLLSACSTVPITGRSQLNLIPGSSMLSMSLQQYDQFLKEHKLSTNQEQTQMVKRVGLKIQNAVERYFASNGLSSQLANYKWEFNLVEDKQLNAWCMPGGKVVVYTGILPVTKDETGLAVVMGHEIAHAIAEHGNERMSQGLMAQMGGVALSTALSTQPAATQQLWMAAYGLGSQYGAILPYGRLQESEADHLGLIFMAMAGYSPNEAVGFWQRMAAQKGGNTTPEFLSTHPADATRIQNIQRLIPEAMKYYRP